MSEISRRKLFGMAVVGISAPILPAAMELSPRASSVVDSSGAISPQWKAFLRELYQRAGGRHDD